MFSGVPLWECPRCHSRMLYAYRSTHNCDCPDCGETINGAVTHECDQAGVADREAERAHLEMRDDNLATLLHDWGNDATKDLSDEQQDAHVTIVAMRRWAEWLRERDL